MTKKIYLETFEKCLILNHLPPMATSHVNYQSKQISLIVGRLDKSGA